MKLCDLLSKLKPGRAISIRRGRRSLRIRSFRGSYANRGNGMELISSDVAGMAGLEPTISESKSGVLPLHYIPKLNRKDRRPRPPAFFKWGGIWGSNPRHPEPQSGALPTELIPPNRPRKLRIVSLPIRPRARTLARQEGFEPPTYCLEGNCSILLSYWRIFKGAVDPLRLWSG